MKYKHTNDETKLLVQPLLNEKSMCFSKVFIWKMEKYERGDLESIKSIFLYMHHYYEVYERNLSGALKK